MVSDKMKILTEEEVSFYHKKGYIIIRNFFNEETVEKLRDACLHYAQNGEFLIKGDILSLQAFDNIILHPRIITVVKQLLGDEIIYYGDSTAQGNAKVLHHSARHFHADARDDDFDFRRDYPILRMGIYLQDHDNYSGGLKIRPESHKTAGIEGRSIRFRIYNIINYMKKYRTVPPFRSFFAKKSINLKTKAGDLLLWNLRLHHSGHAMRLKFMPNLSLHPALERFVPKFMQLPESRERCTIFCSFGAPSDYFERHLSYLVDEGAYQEYWKNCRFDDPKIQKIAKEAGVKLRFDVLRKFRPLAQKAM